MIQAQRQRGVQFDNIGKPFTVAAAAPDSGKSRPGDVRYTWKPSQGTNWFSRDAVLEDKGGFQVYTMLPCIDEQAHSLADQLCCVC